MNILHTYRTRLCRWRASVLAMLAVCAVCMAVSSPAAAQEAKYAYDFGGQIGMSGYLGDANTSSLLRHPGISLDASARYIPNSRMALRGLLGVVTLSGNTADMTNWLPGGAQYKFTSTVIELGARGEFNFLPYGIGETYKKLSRVSPYITLGAGVCMSLSGGKAYFAPTLPMGIGVKYKWRERINLTAEFTMTKVFGDKVDGSLLNDLTGIKTDFYKSTDWISRFSVGISFEFGERCETCHYVD